MKPLYWFSVSAKAAVPLYCFEVSIIALVVLGFAAMKGRGGGMPLSPMTGERVVIGTAARYEKVDGLEEDGIDI